MLKGPETAGGGAVGAWAWPVPAPVCEVPSMVVFGAVIQGRKEVGLMVKTPSIAWA